MFLQYNIINSLNIDQLDKNIKSNIIRFSEEVKSNLKNFKKEYDHLYTFTKRTGFGEVKKSDLDPADIHRSTYLRREISVYENLIRKMKGSEIFNEVLNRRESYNIGAARGT